MDLTPLFCVVRVMKMPLLLLIRGLLLVVSTVSVISSVSRIDISVVQLLLHGPLATGLKKSSPDFGSLNAYVSNCEQINHCSGLLHGDLLHSLDIANSIVEGIDDLDVLDIWDVIPDVVEMFHIVSEALIMLLLDGLQSLCSRWMLIRALEVLDEHATYLVPSVDRSVRQVDKP
jgi:hypothetical protein